MKFWHSSVVCIAPGFYCLLCTCVYCVFLAVYAFNFYNSMEIGEVQKCKKRSLMGRSCGALPVKVP